MASLLSAVVQSMNEAPIPVMQFCNTSVRGGAEEHILTLLRGLDRKDFRLHLVCSPELADALSSDLPPDVELLPLSYPAPSHVAGAARLGRWIRERHIQVLHSHLFTSSLCSSPVGWMCRVPFIVETPHVRESWRRGWKAKQLHGGPHHRTLRGPLHCGVVRQRALLDRGEGPA